MGRKVCGGTPAINMLLVRSLGLDWNYGGSVPLVGHGHGLYIFAIYVTRLTASQGIDTGWVRRAFCWWLVRVDLVVMVNRNNGPRFKQLQVTRDEVISHRDFRHCIAWGTAFGWSFSWTEQRIDKSFYCATWVHVISLLR